MVFPIIDVDHVVLVAEVLGELQHVDISFKDISKDTDFFWKAGHERCIVETVDDGSYHTWIWEIGTQPIDITPTGSDLKIIDAFIENEKILILYFQSDSKNLYLYTYHAQDQSTVQDFVFHAGTSQPGLRLNKFAKIGEKKYVFPISDTIHGTEPWVYNAENNELKILSDIYEGPLGSNPDHFITLQAHTYFTAFDKEEGNQMYVINSNTNSINSVNKDDKFLIYPNPISDHIIIKSIDKLQAYDISISDSFGRAFSNITNRTSDQTILCADWPSGLYLVTITSKGNIVKNQKIMKVE